MGTFFWNTLYIDKFDGVQKYNVQKRGGDGDECEGDDPPQPVGEEVRGQPGDEVAWPRSPLQVQGWSSVQRWDTIFRGEVMGDCSRFFHPNIFHTSTCSGLTHVMPLISYQFVSFSSCLIWSHDKGDESHFVMTPLSGTIHGSIVYIHFYLIPQDMREGCHEKTNRNCFNKILK